MPADTASPFNPAHLAVMQRILGEFSRGEFEHNLWTTYFDFSGNNTIGLVVPPQQGRSICLTAFSVASAKLGAQTTTGLQWLQGNSTNDAEPFPFTTVGTGQKPGLFYGNDGTDYSMSVKPPEYLFRTDPGKGIFLFVSALFDESGWVSFYTVGSPNE